MSKNFSKLILSIVICEGAGLIGAFFTISAIPGWYKTLNKPVFSPPNFLFGPVWTTLYVLMGISFYLVWIKRKPSVLFLIHLFFNASWSILFFGMHNIFLAFIDILIIWLFIIILILKFFKIDKRASWLLFPYLLWVSFATILNYSIWILNK